MKILRLTLTAQEPLVLTDGSAESMAHACLDYAPGSMLLGAFARTWLQAHRGENPDASPSFRRLFLDGEVSWGRALPTCCGMACVPVPKCFYREKHAGDLPLCNGAAGARAIYNSLESAEASDEGMLADWQRENGRAKDEKVKFSKLGAAFMNPLSFCQPDLHKVWNTRVALGDMRSAREGQLFGFSALARDSVLQAEIYCRSEDAENDLKAILPLARHIRLGHARSAGYGRVEIDYAWQEKEPEALLKGRVFNLFLLSAYLPLPDWDAPLDNLLRKLYEKTGTEPEYESIFIAPAGIDGFNGHWQRPRDSRIGLEAGSVIRVRFAKEATLPERMELGGECLEGYGRILVNPAFLQERVIHARPCVEMRKTKPVVKLDRNDPVARLLRQRAIERHARFQALAWLHDPRWKRFLEEVAKNSKPGASQRNSAMKMTRAEFEERLAKSAACQWKEAAPDPFGKKENARKQLEEIMRSLLDIERFRESFPLTEKLLCPGEADDADRKRLEELAHAVFKRELGKSWNRLANAGGREKA